MASARGSAIRIGIVLVGMTAAAKNNLKLQGVWALDSAGSTLRNCRGVETIALYVEYTAPNVTVLELVNDEAGRHLLKRR